MSNKPTYTEDMTATKGFIEGYMHTGESEFVPVGLGEDPKQGYYKIPKDSIAREMHVKNLIVNKASIFMAKRMTPGASWGSGIGYLELGTGAGQGTTQNPQAETLTQTVLRTPLARKAISSWTFLDPSGNATATETNVVQYTTVFNETEAIGAIVEMALFGGNATATLGTGYMFNYKTFPVWNKTNLLKLTVVWTITF